MESFIKSFSINGLFGYKNVQIDFDEPYKIIVGENGSGKTTVLNCLYYTLAKKFELLANIRFDSISIIFKKNKTLEFTKNEVSAFIEKDDRYQNTQFYRLLSDKVQIKDIENFKSIVYSKTDASQKADLIINKLKKLGFNFNTPSIYIYQNVVRLVHEYMAIEFEHKTEIINNILDATLFYFPTYRRVESSMVGWDKISEKLSDKYPFLDKEEILEALNNEFIQFGMDDVKMSINKLTTEINRMTMEGFSSIMGGMLSQLSRGMEDDKRKYIFEEDKIRIILDRLGEEIKEEDKESIKKYASSNTLDNKNLNYLIGKLIKLYEDQKEYDSAIKKFRDTCNRYLKEKEFVYNESSIDLFIESLNTQERLDLECLSSGEKQIVSLFSKIYLDIDHNFIILLDEPELSLSLFWQELLLPDIESSGKCSFLMAVTHSPFIYNNSMQKYACGLSDFIK